jgi:hypothetical protein
MSGDFDDANYNVTKIRTNNGEVAELELNNKKVALASDVKIQDKKEVTIKVSEYTEPVEITPTAGKDGMKKATVTLSNIPSGGATAYAWRCSRSPELSQITYFNVSVAPNNANDLLMLSGDFEYGLSIGHAIIEGDTYIKNTDTEFSISWNEGGTINTQTFTRDSVSKDIAFWG